MPKTLMKKRIMDELSDMQKLERHMGFKLQAVGRKLAKEFNVYNYQLRNRMIHVGFPAARGSLNFVEDDYITPFAFDLSECHGSQTFVISPKEMLDEYVRNDVFRALIDTGRYIYVDGHICLNEPQYIAQQGDKLRLTERANAHVDQCCLRFVRNYIRDKRTHYVFGQLNSDEEYNGRSLALSVQNGTEDAFRQAQEMSEVLLNLPGSFSGTLVAHMKRIGITREKLAEEAMLSDTTIKRMRTSERDLTLDFVIAVCVGLHIPPEYSFDMIEKAGFRLRNTPEHLNLQIYPADDVYGKADNNPEAACEMRLRRTQTERKKRIVAARLSAFMQVDGLFSFLEQKSFSERVCARPAVMPSWRHTRLKMAAFVCEYETNY